MEIKHEIKINYIIASYGAKNKRKYSHPEDTLKIHLRQLKELKNNITQITLMKPDTENNPVYEGYYDPLLEKEMNIECHAIENQGYSNGQWLRGYERRKINYDYYILCEDDYCPGINCFDSILVQLYRKKFPTNIGFMASLIQGQPKHEIKLPLHHEGLVVVSRETVEKIYNMHPNPKVYLTYTQYPFVNIIHGGREQVNFTTIFRINGINIQDTIEDGYSFIYWNDCDKDNYGGEIFFFNKPEIYSEVSDKYFYENLNFINPFHSLGIPIQFARTCVLVAGMHRSGTSVFSGCLNISGLDYGKNKAQVKDSFNQNGYFENMSVLHFNENTLSAINSHWHDISPLTQNQVENMLDRKDILTNLIREEFTTNIFFIKDPRISILLPLYLEVLKRLCIRVVIIFIDRNNLSISKSLQRAQGINFNKGLALCQKYKNYLIRNKNDRELIKFDFYNFISDPVSYIQDILNTLYRGQILTDKQKENISNFVNRKYINY
jgi:hypothetical protein